MTFDEFRKDLKLTEGEAHDLIYHLAALRMRETLGLLNKIPPDKSASELINDWRASADKATGG
jgi:hypothetical protein